MLNRRLARIRAMQGLYALETAKGANFLLAQDLISESFAPDLNSMEVQDRNKLSGLAQLTQSLFEDEVKKRQLPTEESLPVEVKIALTKAREFLKIKNKKDTEFHVLQTLQESERTYDIYLYILNLLVLIGTKSDSVLSKNRAISALRDSKELEVLSLKRTVNFDADSSMINKLYNEAIKNNPHVEEYVNKVNKTFEDDLAIVKYLVKNVILKHTVTTEYFEKIHILWSEDIEILRTMVFHTFNDFVEKNTVIIEVLDYKWDETKDFLRILLKESTNKDEELLDLILPHLKNWDIDRIIVTDLILVKMAIVEWISFPSIPVKVTINEIIEISKNYSSEKSKIFINGILDTLYKDLTNKGEIKKTGRGMLDNK